MDIELLQQKAPGELLVEEAEAINEGDLQAWEAERELHELQTAVYQEVDLQHHLNTMAMTSVALQSVAC